MHLDERMKIVTRRGLFALGAAVYVGTFCGTAYILAHFIGKYW